MKFEYGEWERGKLVWWSPPRRLPKVPGRSLLERWTDLGRRENLGDYLSPVIVDRILQQRGMRLMDMRADRRLLAAGSIVHLARDGDVVWGSGVFPDIGERGYRFERLDVRALRGPLSKEFLEKRGISCPDVFGDPASLVGLLFDGFRRKERRRAYVVVPHFRELGELGFRGHPILSPLSPWRRYLEVVSACEFVVSGSLHGIIVAESLGIPARLVRETTIPPIGKFEDYYLGTGREGFRAARSVSEALDLGGEPLPRTDPQELLDAFPYDLWGATGGDDPSSSLKEARGETGGGAMGS